MGSSRRKPGVLLNNWGTPIDLTNPAAYAWWQDLIRRYTDMGIEGFKLDYGEDVVPGLLGVRNVWQFADGSDERTHARRFQLFYHRVYAETLPREGGFLLCRHGTYGSQRNASVIWPGDLDATFAQHREMVGDGRRRVHGGRRTAGLGRRGSQPRPVGIPVLRRGHRRLPPLAAGQGAVHALVRADGALDRDADRHQREHRRLGVLTGDRLRRRDARLVPHLHAAAPAALPVRVDLRAAHRRRRTPDPAAARPRVSRSSACTRTTRTCSATTCWSRRCCSAACASARWCCRPAVVDRLVDERGLRRRPDDHRRCAARHAAALLAQRRHRAPAASDHRHARAHDRAGARRLVRHRPRRALSAPGSRRRRVRALRRHRDPPDRRCAGPVPGDQERGRVSFVHGVGSGRRARGRRGPPRRDAARGGRGPHPARERVGRLDASPPTARCSSRCPRGSTKWKSNSASVLGHLPASKFCRGDTERRRPDARSQTESPHPARERA